MIPDRLGPVGALAADRPLLSTLVIAFGLTALAVLGAAEAPASAGAVAELIAACALVATAPLIVAAVAPQRLVLRLAIAAAVAALPIAINAAPDLRAAIAIAAPPHAAIAFAVFTVLLLAIAPLAGAALRFAFIAAIAALLGMAGALGLMALQGDFNPENAFAFAGLGFAVGAVVGVNSVFDFSALFARGADRRKAAGGAARYAAAPALYAAIVSGLAAAIFAWPPSAPVAANAAYSAAASSLLSATAALVTAAAALALRRSSEIVAVEENRRRESFRRAWRPVRAMLAPSTAIAIVLIVVIADIAAGFALAEPPFLGLWFAGAVAVVAGVAFYSIRTAAFIFIGVASCAFLAHWAMAAIGAPRLERIDEAAALAISAVLAAVIAVCWRDARSPRLNARETTQYAMAEGFARYVVAGLAGGAALYGASLTGGWAGGANAAAYFGALAIGQLLFAAPLMTALTHIVRRDLN